MKYYIVSKLVKTVKDNKILNLYLNVKKDDITQKYAECKKLYGKNTKIIVQLTSRLEMDITSEYERD